MQRWGSPGQIALSRNRQEARGKPNIVMSSCRLMFFEQARAQAQNEYEQDGSNAAVSLFRKDECCKRLCELSFESPRVCQALTRWGGALLELAHFRQGEEAREMIKEVSNLPLFALSHAFGCWLITLDVYMQAVRKLETALKLDDSKPETLWCLGNAYTSEASA